MPIIICTKLLIVPSTQSFKRSCFNFVFFYLYYDLLQWYFESSQLMFFEVLSLKLTPLLLPESGQHLISNEEIKGNSCICKNILVNNILLVKTNKKQQHLTFEY